MAGENLARDGAPLDDGLEALRVTAQAVLGRLPSFEDTRALSTAWSEVTLGYLHQTSCEDPLTGLSSVAHVRTRLAEQRRHGDRHGDRHGARALRHTHALVLVDLPTPPSDDRWSRSLRLAQVGEAARTVFSGGETIGRLGVHRIVVVCERDDRMARRVTLLRTLVQSVGPGARVWIEGLPSTDDATASLLDELARS